MEQTPSSPSSGSEISLRVDVDGCSGDDLPPAGRPSEASADRGSPWSGQALAPKGALRPCPSPASGGLAGPRRVSFSCETPTALRGVSHEAFPPCELGTLTPSRVLSHAALEDWAGPGEMGLSSVASPPQQSAFVMFTDHSPPVRNPEARGPHGWEENGASRGEVLDRQSRQRLYLNEVSPIRTLTCVGQIHEAEDLRDATPRHATVISPIRAPSAPGCVQYEPRVPTSQMVARHLSCVGQIHDEEADVPEFWGMRAPAMWMSPVRKRLTPTWATAMMEEAEVPPIRTMTCVGQIHEAEDLRDATPRHATVISPIRAASAPGCVQYEPRVPTSQMVARHLSCVGQIHEEEADVAEFWGMGAPAMRMSPVRKRLPAAAAGKLAWAMAVAEEVEGLASRLEVSPICTMTCVGQSHEADDLRDATPRHATVISPIRAASAPGYMQYEPRVPPSQMVARHLSCVGQIHEEEAEADEARQLSVVRMSPLPPFPGGPPASAFGNPLGGPDRNPRLPALAEQLQQLSAADVRAVAACLAVPDGAAPPPSFAAVECAVAIQDALYETHEADHCSPLWRAVVRRLLQTSPAPEAAVLSASATALEVTELRMRLEQQEQLVAALERRQRQLEAALRDVPRPLRSPRGVEPTPLPTLAVPELAPRAETTEAHSLAGAPILPPTDPPPASPAYSLALHFDLQSPTRPPPYHAMRTHHVAYHSPPASLGIEHLPLERNSGRPPSTNGF